MTKEIYTRQAAIEALADDFAEGLTTDDKDDYIALYEIAQTGHRGFNDYGNEELREALLYKYNDETLEIEIV